MQTHLATWLALREEGGDEVRPLAEREFRCYLTSPGVACWTKKIAKLRAPVNTMAVTAEVKATFRPEFVNRIDEVVIFHTLDEKYIAGMGRKTRWPGAGECGNRLAPPLDRLVNGRYWRTIRPITTLKKWKLKWR